VASIPFAKVISFVKAHQFVMTTTSLHHLGYLEMTRNLHERKLVRPWSEATAAI